MGRNGENHDRANTGIHIKEEKIHAYVVVLLITSTRRNRQEEKGGNPDLMADSRCDSRSVHGHTTSRSERYVGARKM